MSREEIHFAKKAFMPPGYAGLPLTNRLQQKPGHSCLHKKTHMP
jgi:hypothetical protein